MTYLIPIYLAAISRMCGSSYKWLGVALYPLPYVLLIGNNIDLTNKISAFCYLSGTFLWVAIWKITGHADGFRNYVRDNTLSPVAVKVSSFFGIKRDSAKYDAIFWAIKGGIIAAIPTAIIAVFSASYIPAIGIFCASFCGYPLAYWIGFNVLNKNPKFPNTAWGETLAGFFAGLGFMTVYIT